MALMLAPYNDSMRLGMGFNSYTQTLCINDAVGIDEKKDTSRNEEQSQAVTYTSKFVERLSDVVSSMNISYSSAIKKGTIEVAGNGNSIDEDKIKSSDLNLVVSVQVVNQVMMVKDGAEPTFKAIDNVAINTPQFNEVFGDCYISGFIEGGEFNSIISMRCMDRSKTSATTMSIKKLAKSSEGKEFSLDAYAGSGSLSNSSAMKDTEVSISVNWTGGGQIKDPAKAWDIDSVYATAAAFPTYVSKTPQRTWAILTKYKANRSYQQAAAGITLQPLEYDSVLSYTAELFNNFMEYKQLIKTVREIIASPADYKAGVGDLAIPPVVSTLIALRSALRTEMNKIAAITSALARDPRSYILSNSFETVSADTYIKNIVDSATKNSLKAVGATKPMLNPPEDKTTDKSGAAVAPSTNTDIPKLDLGALIAPEIWKNLLPIRISGTTTEFDDSGARAAAAATFPMAPKTDSALQFLEAKSITICAAVCGIYDVTDVLQAKVEDDELVLKASDIGGLVPGKPWTTLPQPFTPHLSLIYRIGTGPFYFKSVKHDDSSSDVFRLDTKTDWAVNTTQTGNFFVLAVVYGGKLFDPHSGEGAAIYKQIGEKGYATLNNATMGDPWPGTTKAGIVYYGNTPKGLIRAAVALQDQSNCELSAAPRLNYAYIDKSEQQRSEDALKAANTETQKFKDQVAEEKKETQKFKDQVADEKKATDNFKEQLKTESQKLTYLVPQSGIIKASDMGWSAGSQTTAVTNIKFPTAFGRAPNMISGLNKILTDKSAKTSVSQYQYDPPTKEGFVMNFSGQNKCFCHEFSISWMTLPDDMQIDHGLARCWFDEPEKSYHKERVWFNHYFRETPVVSVWLKKLDINGHTEKAKMMNLNLTVTKVDECSFDIEINCKDTKFCDANIGWLAYPSGDAGKRCNSGKELIEQPTNMKSGSLLWPSGKRSRTPATFIALKSFTISTEEDLRCEAKFTNVTDSGAQWEAGTWGDTKMKSMEFTWIAIE